MTPPGKYRRRSFTVTAVQWHGESNCQEVFDFVGLEHPEDEMDHSLIHIETWRGVETVYLTDWVVRDERGQLGVCRDDLFTATFEPAEDPDDTNLTETQTDQMLAEGEPVDVGPLHIGGGANAEDCPGCEGTNPPYPSICPGEVWPPIRCNQAHLLWEHKPHRWEPQPGSDTVYCPGHPQEQA